MSQLAAIGWVLLALAWLMIARRTRAAARAADGPIPRWTAAAAAGGLAVVAAAAALALALLPAWGARREILAGGDDASARSPARARLFLHYVQVALPAEAANPGGVAIGYGPDAGLRMPGTTAGALLEARRGWDLFRVGARGARGLAAQAVTAPEPTTTHVVAAALPDALVEIPDVARRADQVARACRAEAPRQREPIGRASIQARDLARGDVTLPGPGTLVAVVCSGARPVAALAFSRPDGPGQAGGAVRVAPLVRRGNRFEPHHIEVGPRSLLQVGSSVESAPGVDLWEVPAPSGAARLFLPPPDPFAPCRAWSASMGHPAGESPERAADAARSTPADEDASTTCVLPFSAPFAFEVRRLLPDTAGLAGRALWACAMLALPALGWLLWLAAARRSRLTRARLADALAAAWVGLVLAGLATWRLVWAHRIDMLREYEAAGWRVIQNQVLIALVAACLAATCALRAEPGLSARRRLLLATGAWSAAGALGLLALGADRTAFLADRSVVAAAVSFLLGVGPLLVPIVGRRLRAAAEADASRAPTPGAGLAGTGGGAVGPTRAGRGASGRSPAGAAPALFAEERARAAAADAEAANAITQVEVATASRGPRELAVPGEPPPVGADETASARARGEQPHHATAVGAAAWVPPRRDARPGAGAPSDAATGEATRASAPSEAATGEATRASAPSEAATGGAAGRTAPLFAAAWASERLARGEGARAAAIERAAARTALADAPTIPGDDVTPLLPAPPAAPRLAPATPPGSPARRMMPVSARVTPVAALVAAAGAAALLAAVAPREPSLKLALAWAIALLFHGALASAVQQARVQPGRLYAAAGAGAAAAMAALALDAGIATAIVLPGLVFALLFAAHDASFDDRALRQVGSYRRRHAPLAACHAALVLAIALGAALWGAAGLGGPGPDGEGGGALTRAGFHLPLLVAGFLAPAALLVARRRGRAAAWPWIAAAGLALAVWMARGPLLDEVLASDSQAASRIALVSEPGYALLRNPDRFLAGLTAWRETGMPGAASAWTGQGYFGAQLIDPGVLLSVDNDYLNVLVLRESGAAGLLAPALLLLGAAAGLFLLAGDRFRRGGAPERRRALVALLLGALAIYQPLAALGALPLTGLPWPGLGIDSPSDFWLLTALLLFVAVWGRADDAELDAYDADLRRERRFTRLRRAEQAAALVVIAAAALVLTRAALAAAARPASLPGTTQALAYARDLRCGDGEASASVPASLGGRPTDAATDRFDAELRARWVAERTRAAALLARLAARADGGADACEELGSAGGSWRAMPGDGPGECRLVLDLGLPRIELSVSRAAGGAAPAIACQVGPTDETLRRLRLPTARPLEGARVRLVSRAMGAAARDVGEMMSGSSVVRLRPGAEPISAVSGRPGLVAAGRVALPGGAAVRADDDGARLELAAGSRRGDVTLLLHDGEASGGWSPAPIVGPVTPLDRVALLVVNGEGGASSGAWLFRPRTRWPGDGDAVVDPILADDAATAAGPTRRAYPYGGLLPEVGWVNRFQRRRSLGLDGWVRVAVDEITAAGSAAAGAATAGAVPPGPAWAGGGLGTKREGDPCGPLDPPLADPGRVCAVAADGVVECRVSIQPELAVRMHHLTQLISLEPGRFAGGGDKFAAPMRASFALMRGDTGEILSQGEFVPGRAASLYAPATAAGELRLIRAREDRDLDSGALLPRSERGETSGEKAEWNQPIAVGSALKPVVARAFERTSPDLARGLVLRGSPFDGAACRGSRAHAILGHCPPTDSLWNHPEDMTMTTFLARSANWYMAALGILGTALPDGRIGLGGGEVALDELLMSDVGDHATDAALWTERGGRPIVTASHAIDLDALREAPMWKGVEAVLGRRMCALGDKASCRAAGDRADLCAARALPVAAPTADLRHLVATGPDTFDFQPERRARAGSRVAALEYLQFLRGSGVHPVGSLLQLTDAFGRVVYEPTPGARGYRLAASWFPVAPVTAAPAVDCAQGPTGDPVRDGLCDVVRSGTAARALGPLLADPSVVIYGAKTGTIDSLADVAQSRAACAAFRDSHTLADRDRRPADQPYWLRCADSAAPPDDSLLLVAFGVPTPGGGTTPLTLGLRFQRSGAGFASLVARHYLDLVRDYFAPAAPRLP